MAELPQQEARPSVSEPSTSASHQQHQQSARLVARSWNYRTKQRHNYNTANLDRPLTEGEMPYNYDSTFTQHIQRDRVVTPTRSGARRRRSDITIAAMTDVEFTYDELFEKEIVQIPPRLELASQAETLNKLITKANAAGAYSFSNSLLPKPTLQPELHRSTKAPKHISKAEKLLRSVAKTEDTLQDTSIYQQAQVEDEEHIQAKFRCLMNRDITFIHTLPETNCHPLNTLLDETWRNFQDGRYCDCLPQLKKCFVVNSDTSNRSTLFFNQAVVLAYSNRFGEAMNALNEAIKLDPEVPRYYKLRSVFWRVKERYTEASKDSKRALNIEHNKASHKNAQHLARKALQAITLINASAKRHHIPTKSDWFVEAYETPPSQRSQAHLDVLVDQSDRISCLANLSSDMLFVLWRNFSFTCWPTGTKTWVGKSSVSMYVVMEGTITVQTEAHGEIQIHKTLQPGDAFCEASISANLWTETLLEALTACKVLMLDNTVYKHTMRKVMMEGATRRAEFFTSTGIFAEWTDEQRNSLGILSEYLTFNAGDVVVSEGEPATHLYFVQSGLCGAVRLLGTEQTRIQIATLSSGDVFGEAAVLDPINGRIQFTIVASTVCKIIRVEKNYLNKRKAFELLLGPLSKDILAKLHRFSVRCPQDKLLVQMIQNNCKWQLERKNVLKEFAKDMIKAHGKLSLPRVQSDPLLSKQSFGR
ncbi:hypothetical protein Ae201684P_008789 [Aphanomyces euteiches]|uniref:Cyclic nucleotide-binding domain-containing protein n=1 Tax=Aphanomyces euteiches TaxID=100861 RepID=A0A6G0XPS8_9STRA|nr:hypothetical protein Ae201684_002674 [Aphanomyces euteiches]KAH9093129.1 hypothetical protein Ae201684P_008789 [Aphanomyces euteiches]KAH9157817.1 hypothetical protein AeRB84_000372 [Aphanomyces euteiches]